jgi:pimeloyl-ACP methyl ester carboxylesterase
MIHGSGWSQKVFAKQFDSVLAGTWRLLALDLPGHGASDDAQDPQASYSITGFAECIEDVIDQFGLPRLALFGWSLGGHLAIEVASRSDRVAGLMVTGAPPVPPGFIGMLRGFHPSFDMLLASKQNFSQRDRDRFTHLSFGKIADPAFAEMILRTDGRVRTRFSQSMMRGEGADQRRTVEQASVPVAFVNGEDDPFVRASYLSSLDVPLLYGEKPLIVEGAGHAPFWEKPTEFNALLDGFLQMVTANEDGASRSARHSLRG